MKEANRELNRLDTIPPASPGIRRDPHLPADPQRIALVDHAPRTSSIWPRPGRFSTATITTWTRSSGGSWNTWRCAS